MKTSSLMNCVTSQTWFKNSCFFQMLPAVNDVDEGGVPPGGLDRQTDRHVGKPLRVLPLLLLTALLLHTSRLFQCF